MAHIGKYYRLAIRRDFRTQQFNNRFAFPHTYNVLVNFYGGLVAAAFNGLRLRYDDGNDAMAVGELTWVSPIKTVFGTDYTVRIHATLETGYANGYTMEVGIVGGALIYREQPLLVQSGIPYLTGDSANMIFQTPGAWTIGTHGSWDALPDFW